MKKNRTFPTTAAVRYDQGLRRSLALNPPLPHMTVPQPTEDWPEENIALLEQYREWLVGIGAADSVINHRRIPMAGHVLGLTLRPHAQLNLVNDFERAVDFVAAQQVSDTWQHECRHSLDWFRRFVKEERGLVIIDKPSFGDVERYKAGLPNWLIEQLTKFLHIRQANWRPSRMAQSTYQFWYKTTRIWRWLFDHTEIQEPKEITRNHIFAYIDEQLWLDTRRVPSTTTCIRSREHCAFCSSRGWRFLTSYSPFLVSKAANPAPFFDRWAGCRPAG
ncbi:MAG: hypothetical protein M5U34_26945 [Chloroflexi bacterium]|nr:hypothetical protein [Chloroflexota bacterium]